MTYVFWLALFLVLYTYAGYPLLMGALAKRLPRPWRRDAHPATVSVIMAVHNGEALLPWKIGHLLALDPKTIREIIIVSDGSTDRTSALLTEIQDARVRVILMPEQLGKSAAVNAGVQQATGDILLFTDLRPRIQEGALAALLRNFADPAIGCVAGELIVQSGKEHGPTTSAVGGLYWKYEQWIRTCESLWDSPVGVYGGFYAIRRSLTTRIPEGLILDDMFQPLSVVRQGYRSVIDREAVVIDRWPSSTAHEFARKVRTLAGNFQLLREAPWVLTRENRVLFQLISHKLLRLAVPWMFLAMLFCSLALGSHSAVWSVAAVLQLLFWLLAALASKVQLPVMHRVAAPASALLMLNAAAVAALYVFLFTKGPLWRIWKPTAAITPPPFTLHEGGTHA